MMNIAQKEAEKSSCRCQHGSVVARKSAVLGRGHNTYKTHATWGGGPLSTLHAEAAAIRDAVNRGCDLRGSVIYVARTGRGSHMSRPCENCQRIIRQHGIRKVYYTDENGVVVSEWPLQNIPV